MTGIFTHSEYLKVDVESKNDISFTELVLIFNNEHLSHNNFTLVYSQILSSKF